MRLIAVNRAPWRQRVVHAVYEALRIVDALIYLGTLTTVCTYFAIDVLFSDFAHWGDGE